MKKIITLLFVISLLTTPDSMVFASSTANTYGFSARGIAMGNAMCATVEDWSAVFYNISGLGKTAHLKGHPNRSSSSIGLNLKERSSGSDDFYQNQLAFGYFYTMPMFKVDINRSNANGPIPTKAADNLDYGVTVLGVAFDINAIYRLPSIISSARFGIGMMANDDLTVVKVNDISPKTHNFLRYGREAQRTVILTGLGIGFMDDLFGIGGGANISFTGEGRVLLDNVRTTSDPQQPEGSSRMDMTLDPTIVAGIYFNPGKILSFIQGLQIGIAYRQASQLEIYPFKTAAIVNSGLIEMEMILALFDYYTPNTYIFGIAFSRWNATVSLEFEYQAWSDYNVSSVNYANFQNLPELDDIIVPKLGASYKVLDWVEVLAGYYFQPSFVPDEANKGEYNFLDNDKHVGSLGAQITVPRMYGMGGPLEIAISYQLQYLVPRSVVKDNPTTYNPNYEYGGMAHSAMMNITMRL